MPELDNSSLISIDKALNLDHKQTISLHKAHLNPTLISMLKLLDFDKRYTKAEGCYVWDEQGQRYLDFLAGYGSLNLGHNHPKVKLALDKVESLPNILQTTPSPLAGALAKNLSIITPGKLKHSFLCNSGAEAVEAALKTARAATGKNKIIYTDGAFHGKTMGALSVSGREKYKSKFKPLIGGCDSVPFGETDNLKEKLADRDIAAFIVEPIQGEGGIIVPPGGYLKRVSELCSENDALLILDEIQTGMGRTGTMFACEIEGIEPDLMTVSKSLGGGMMPIGALITSEKVWKQAYGGFDKALLHTSTFGGNARACAAAIAAINAIVEEDLPARALKHGSYLLDKLMNLKDNHKAIKDIRGRGLLVGIEFQEPYKGFSDNAAFGAINSVYKEYFTSVVASQLLNEYRIITAYTLNNPNVLRLQPALIIEKEDIDYLVDAIDKICAKNRSLGRTMIQAGRIAASRYVPRKTKK